MCPVIPCGAFDGQSKHSAQSHGGWASSKNRVQTQTLKPQWPASHSCSFMCHESHLQFMLAASVCACVCLCTCGYLSWRTGDILEVSAVRMWFITLCVFNRFCEPMFPLFADRTNIVSALAALRGLRQHAASEKLRVLPQMFSVSVDCNKQAVALGTIFRADGFRRIPFFCQAL